MSEFKVSLPAKTIPAVTDEPHRDVSVSRKKTGCLLGVVAAPVI
jgi:hypothetical protein